MLFVKIFVVCVRAIILIPGTILIGAIILSLILFLLNNLDTVIWVLLGMIGAWIVWSTVVSIGRDIIDNVKGGITDAVRAAQEDD